MDKEIIYIASPYTIRSPQQYTFAERKQIYQKRYEDVTDYAAWLAKQKKLFYAPITMTHPLLPLTEEATSDDWHYWMELDRPYMELCTQLNVLQLDEWQLSSGIKEEVEHFLRKGAPIFFVDQFDYTKVVAHKGTYVE